MSEMKILVNSFLLTLINLISILCGFCAYHFLGTKNQIAIQVLVACLFSVFSFLSWEILSFKIFKNLLLISKRQYIKTFILSIVWTPILFTPLHYIAEGYQTSIQNIIGIWFFQIPTNILILKLYHHFSLILDIKYNK